MKAITRHLLANAIIATLATASAVPSCFAQSTVTQEKTTMNQEQARQLIAPFYDMLNQPATKNLKALGESAIAPNWRSCGGENNCKGREEFIGQVGGFGKMIPDLSWSIKEVLVDGNRIIVRSEATGTPAGPFFGVPHGGKSFRIMTIDIHTVQDGKLVKAHHVEDWAGAIKQLSAK